MKTWVLAFLALLLTAGARQYTEWDEWRDTYCPVFDKVEWDYMVEIRLYEMLHRGDPVEIARTRWKLERLLEIKSHVCLEI